MGSERWRFWKDGKEASKSYTGADLDNQTATPRTNNDGRRDRLLAVQGKGLQNKVGNFG